MDMQSFRRDAMDVLARRSMEMLRELAPAHLRQLATDALRPKPSALVPIASAALGLVVGAAIGAGVTLFVTPVSGPAMRKKVASQGRRARARATELVQDAGRAVQAPIQSASMALGIGGPTHAKRAARVTNGHNHRRSSKRPTHHASA